jgi:hypothetical protein
VGPTWIQREHIPRTFDIETHDRLVEVDESMIHQRHHLGMLPQWLSGWQSPRCETWVGLDVVEAKHRYEGWVQVDHQQKTVDRQSAAWNRVARKDETHRSIPTYFHPMLNQ